MDLESYFTRENIINQLCKLRVVTAQRKHKHQLANSIARSKIDKAKEKKCKKIEELSVVLNSLMPPRSHWKSLGKENRKNLTIIEKNQKALRFHIRKAEKLAPKEKWLFELEKFINDVRFCFNDGKYNFSEPFIIPQFKERKVEEGIIYRPLTLYPLKDRIIISLTSKYLTKAFDSILKKNNCTLAFRPYDDDLGAILNHHSSVDKIIEFRKVSTSRTLYVGECDIKKFYDCVNHDLALKAFETFRDKVEIDDFKIDNRASMIFKKYLDSFSFQKDVWELNGTEYFIENNFNVGNFSWEYNELFKLYGGAIPANIGIPQGGAISCLISNIFLHQVDDKVLHYDGKKFDGLYLRYCDDMIIIHPNKDECKKAMNRYSDALTELKFAFHKSEPIEKEEYLYGKNFWKSKAKPIYEWSNKAINKGDIYSPWLSFVGYDVRYDGKIRIRAKSLKKEIKKQSIEGKRVVRKLAHTLKKESYSLNLNKKEIALRLYTRYISMSVGKVKIYDLINSNHKFSWVGGFEKITNNFILNTQLKNLDRRRNKNITKIEITLDKLLEDKVTTNGEKKKMGTTDYFGMPFSYFGALKKYT